MSAENTTLIQGSPPDAIVQPEPTPEPPVKEEAAASAGEPPPAAEPSGPDANPDSVDVPLDFGPEQPAEAIGNEPAAEPVADPHGDGEWFDHKSEQEPKPVLVSDDYPRRPASGKYSLLVGLVMSGLAMLVMAYSVIRSHRENVAATVIVTVERAKEVIQTPPPAKRFSRHVDASKCKPNQYHIRGHKLTADDSCVKVTLIEEPSEPSAQ